MTQSAKTLQVTTPSDREVVFTRAFDAPRELVFEAWTNPEHVRHWWGLRESTMLLCEADVRQGGSWRYVTTAEDGAEVPFTGVYQEVTPPERLVYTEMYDVEPFNSGDPAVNTVTFTPEEGGTLVTVTTVYPSKEVRDFALSSGMEAGAAESYDRLAEHLTTLA
ncbi:MAG TPA: SRPBCC family protein [Candidatus Dormibacteraeota bacterium]